MREASILLTAAVMSMAGAWYAMQDMARGASPVPPPALHTELASLPGPVAE